VGARGHSLPSHLTLGGTADRVIRSATVPVLTVPTEGEIGLGAVRTVLVATDLSDHALAATTAALRLLSSLDSAPRIVMLHVCEVPVDFGTYSNADIVMDALALDEGAARAELDEHISGLDAALTIEPLVRTGPPAQTIRDVAETLDADLLVLGTHGRHGMSHLLFGSVAERIVHRAGCPVLTAHVAELHPREDATPAESGSRTQPA